MLRITSDEPFGFRSALHEIFVDGTRVTDAQLLIEEDGNHARIVGTLPPGDVEVRYGDRDIWRVY